MKISSYPRVQGTAALALTPSLETEFAKESWDVRNIPGLRYPPHAGPSYIHFHAIPERFRPIAKDHAKFLIAADRAAQTVANYTRYLEHFFLFFSRRYPDAWTLRDLTEQDIDAFVVHLKAEAHQRKLKGCNTYVSYHIQKLEGFLAYLERLQSPLRPELPTARLIWPHHYPPLDNQKTTQIKYIPQTVLAQFDAHLHALPPSQIPVMVLLRASGWRISDVLYLKLDTCLEQQGEKFWLVGDI